MESVGRGSNLLLNLPPDRRGRIHEQDAKALLEWKKLKDATFSKNIAEHAKASADKLRGKSKQYAAENVTDGNQETYWATDDEVTSGSIVIELDKSQTLKYLSIQEYIRLGQRVKKFDVEVWKNNEWIKVASGTTIGHKRILPLGSVESAKIRVNITESKACPLISTINVY
jgi:alpha-L-fucosidase